MVDISCQTDVNPEYGTLADYLNPPPPKPVVLKEKTPEVRVKVLDQILGF